VFWFRVGMVPLIGGGIVAGLVLWSLGWL
jgi:hypothetical protein